MKLLWLLGGLVLGSPWGTQGGWTWDEAGARFAPEGQPHFLFGRTELLPPTLWNLPGPEDSLIQYDGDQGRLRLLLPLRPAILEIPVSPGTPNAWTLAGGRILVAENRRISVLYPSPGEGRGFPYPDLPLPVTALAPSPRGEPLARLLSGRWLEWTGEAWIPSASPQEVLPPAGTADMPREESSQDLEAAGLWPEARRLAEVLRDAADRQDAAKVREQFRNAEAVLRGQGALEVRRTSEGLEAQFFPDALGQEVWDWTFRIYPVKGPRITVPVRGAGEIQQPLPPEMAWEDLLWVDVEVCPPESPEKKTFFRMVVPDGLSYWLKSG